MKFIALTVLFLFSCAKDNSKIGYREYGELVTCEQRNIASFIINLLKPNIAYACSPVPAAPSPAISQNYISLSDLCSEAQGEIFKCELTEFSNGNSCGPPAGSYSYEVELCTKKIIKKRYEGFSSNTWDGSFDSDAPGNELEWCVSPVEQSLCSNISNPTSAELSFKETCEASGKIAIDCGCSGKFLCVE